MQALAFALSPATHVSLINEKDKSDKAHLASAWTSLSISDDLLSSSFLCLTTLQRPRSTSSSATFLPLDTLTVQHYIEARISFLFH